MNFQEKKDLYKVRQTVLEMIEDRGYAIPPHLTLITFEQFSIQYDQKTINFMVEDPSKAKKYYVYFHTDKSFGKNDLSTIVDKIVKDSEDETLGIIMLLKDKESTSILKEKAKPKYKNVELFEQRLMRFNPSKHVFVPKHVILTPEEEAEVVDRLQTPKSKFPKISATDVQARYLAMERGQMCKIVRIDPEVGLSINYRVVV
jgi:DNA-directed RNA polymerase subunit H (RpoH/RPB5)